MLHSKINQTDSSGSSAEFNNSKAAPWKRLAAWVGLPACALLFSWVVLGPAGERVEALAPRLLVFALFASAGAGLLKVALPRLRWEHALAAALILIAAVYRLAAYLPEISTYPLSLGWSETSRYYYASLFLSENIYGIDVPPSVLHPTRYLMQAVPFIISGLPLVAHRIWQVLLWVGFNLAAAWFLARRLSLAGRPQKALFVAWAFLFLYQGPVYYHLLVMAIVVLWTFDRKRSGWSLAWVLGASAWAGVSRINWVPVPGLLAAVLYLLEEPILKPAWRSLVKPAAWTVLGTLTGFASQQAYQTLSGNPVEQFGSSFTSDLLWYRLFPSHTYPLGVVPAVFLASLPLGLLFLIRLAPVWRSYHWLRLLGLAGALFVLLAGGVVVSAKIGGGSNLHNLDAYLTLLLVVGGYLIAGDFIPDDPPPETTALSGRWMPGLALALALAPAVFAVTSGGPLPARDFAQASAALDQLRQVTGEYAAQGDVLFISERHLLSFDAIEDVPLVPEYEKVFLMEMAMSNSRPYLEAFYTDLSNHRFSLIVTHPLRIHYQGRLHQFGEENDAWVRRVTEPVLCYYEPLMDLPGVAVQLFVPKDEPVDCSPVWGE